MCCVFVCLSACSCVCGCTCVCARRPSLNGSVFIHPQLVSAPCGYHSNINDAAPLHWEGERSCVLSGPTYNGCAKPTQRLLVELTHWLTHWQRLTGFLSGRLSD